VTGGLARLVPALLALLTPLSANADGGALIARGEVGPYALSLLASPLPLRVGAIEVSALVQDGATGEMLGLPVELAWWPVGRVDALRTVAAAPGHGANRLLAGASIALTSEGAWMLELRTPLARLPVELAVGPPLPPLRAHWKALAIPPVGVALFALHGWLRRARERSRPLPGATTGRPTAPGAGATGGVGSRVGRS